jgi:hypothetical protein
MRFFADVLVFFGAILLTFGTDLVISTAGEPNTVGGPIGMIASLIGVALLSTGILNHYRISRDEARPPTDADSGVTAKK